MLGSSAHSLRLSPHVVTQGELSLFQSWLSPPSLWFRSTLCVPLKYTLKKSTYLAFLYSLIDIDYELFKGRVFHCFISVPKN